MPLRVLLGICIGYTLAWLEFGHLLHQASGVLLDALLNKWVLVSIVTLLAFFFLVVLLPLLSSHVSGTGVLGVHMMDTVEPITGRKFSTSTFDDNLRRRGSFDMSYLADVMDAAFLRRHATSYLAPARTRLPMNGALSRTFGASHSSPSLPALVLPAAHSKASPAAGAARPPLAPPQQRSNQPNSGGSHGNLAASTFPPG